MNSISKLFTEMISKINDPKILDKLGNEIKDGCFIVYGHALGRSAGLRIGKVLKTDIVGHKYANPGYRITVQGVDDDWPHKTKTLTKRGVLLFPERIIVLLPEQVPTDYREMLESCK